MSDEAPIPFLDLSRQQARLGRLLHRRLESVLEHCQFILGPEVKTLEDSLAAFCGAKHAVSVSSGTDALLIVLMAEGIGPGDAVFLPAFTYTATAEVVLLLGATPIFVDVDPKTFQISPQDLEVRIAAVAQSETIKARMIIGVDLFGQPAPWDDLRAIAQKHHLCLIDDCAQSFGARYEGRRLGCEAEATALSFFPSKPLGAYGDGGAILTQSAEKAALYRSLRSHGEGVTRYDVQRIGINGRLDTLQAAVLLAKLEVFEWELKRREDIASAYDAALAPYLDIPARVPRGQSAWAIYAVLLPRFQERESLQKFLLSRGIPSVVYYPRPLHVQPAYQSARRFSESLPIAEDLSERILALPIHPDLTDGEVQRVIDAVQSWTKDA